ncbi:MAG: hypothetical protein DMG03_12930 [Acidobacteria bacterium]|nr:MAG: hypothetical protein DMG03_12930 [Acidobacteriota bacterium]
MKHLPPAARAYVVAVVALGTVLFFAGLPHIHFGQPLLFAALLVSAAHAERFDDVGVVRG